MEKDIRSLLDETIVNEIQTLSEYEVGSEKRSAAVEELTQLHKLRIEEAKVEVSKAENYDKAVTCDREWEIRRDQLKAEARDRWINFGLQVGIAIGGWIAYDVWHRRGLKFEESGTVGSSWTRNLMSRMLPRK